MATVKKVRKSAAPFYGAAVVWVLWAAFRDLYKPSHFVFVGILSLAVFLLMRAVCKDEVTETVVPDPPKEEEKPTGNAELDKMISDGRKAISEMKRLDDSIADPEVSAGIVRLSRVSEKIFQAVKDNPDKLPQIRQFMNYYLPTTLKLLNAYDRMSGTGVSGENIDGTKTKVEDMLKTIVKAFEKQLDALFGADALDVSADIQVMETLLAREGLKEPEMKADAVQADGTDIRLEL